MTDDPEHEVLSRSFLSCLNFLKESSRDGLPISEVQKEVRSRYTEDAVLRAVYSIYLGNSLPTAYGIVCGQDLEQEEEEDAFAVFQRCNA